MNAAHYHYNIEQGTEEWHRVRLGIITASAMRLVLTKTLKLANNDKLTAHICELAAQRVTEYVEPTYQSFDMLRGHDDEIMARALYEQTRAPVEQVGFITRDFGGFVLGYSPDGLVGDDGLIEVKSRKQKHQFLTIVNAQVPDEYVLQVQTGLLVSGRQWVDFISYSGGMPMMVVRAYPDEKIQEAILDASEKAERAIVDLVIKYNENVTRNNWPMAERLEMEIDA